MTDKHVVLGTGAIGRAVMQELLDRGKSVRMVNRSGKMPEAPAQVEVVAGNLYDPENVRALTSDASVVYQSAQPPYHQWSEEFPRLQRSIIAGLRGTGAKLVLVENLYMYGDTDGQPMTEATPYNAHTRKGRVRAEISREAFEAHKKGDLRVTAARGGNYFGPWGTGSTMGERVFFPLLRGKPAQLIGRTDLPHTHTYVNDFGRALAILGECDEADGQVWHVPNDMPRITQAELVRMFAEEAGLEPRMQSMGRWMMAIGGLFVREARETVEMMYEFEKPFVVDSSKFEKAFGMKATPMRQAIRETLEWYKNHME